MKKKIISLLTTLVIVVGLIGVMPTVSAGAAGTYNVSSAVSYANTHWNDGVGLCAEFVSKCLSAGGISIPNKSYYSSSKQSYENNSGTLGSYTNPYRCSAALLVYLSEKYTVIKNPKSSDIEIGDIAFMYGGSGKWRDGHVGIITNIKNGVPIYSAHNRATNSGKFSSSYPCTYVVKVKVKEHIHNYNIKGVKAAHPHRVYMKCSCGDYYYTGATTISTSCSTCMKKSTKYPTPIKAYTLATGKTTVYNSINGKAKANKIYDTDLCTITAIYDNGWCKVSFPLTSGKTDSGYVKTSVFFNSSYNVTTSKTLKKITTYARSNLSKSIGYAGSGDKVYVIGHTSKAVQIVYPLTAGGYKVGWVPISAFTYTVKYNANGGSGYMSNTSVKYQNSFTLSKNAFKRKGYTFAGWNVYRSSDKKWYVSGKGWYTESEIKSKKYTKKLYANASKYNLNQSWINGAKTNDTYTFYAVWKKNS